MARGRGLSRSSSPSLKRIKTNLRDSPTYENFISSRKQEIRDQSTLKYGGGFGRKVLYGMTSAVVGENAASKIATTFRDKKATETAYQNLTGKKPEASLEKIEKVPEKVDTFEESLNDIESKVTEILTIVSDLSEKLSPRDITVGKGESEQTFRYDPLAPEGKKVTVVTESGKAGRFASKKEASSVLSKAAYFSNLEKKEETDKVEKLPRNKAVIERAIEEAKVFPEPKPKIPSVRDAITYTEYLGRQKRLTKAEKTLRYGGSGLGRKALFGITKGLIGERAALKIATFGRNKKQTEAAYQTIKRAGAEEEIPKKTMEKEIGGRVERKMPTDMQSEVMEKAIPSESEVEALSDFKLETTPSGNVPAATSMIADGVLNETLTKPEIKDDSVETQKVEQSEAPEVKPGLQNAIKKNAQQAAEEEQLEYQEKVLEYLERIDKKTKPGLLDQLFDIAILKFAAIAAAIGAVTAIIVANWDKIKKAFTEVYDKIVKFITETIPEFLMKYIPGASLFANDEEPPAPPGPPITGVASTDPNATVIDKMEQAAATSTPSEPQVKTEGVAEMAIPANAESLVLGDSKTGGLVIPSAASLTPENSVDVSTSGILGAKNPAGVISGAALTTTNASDAFLQQNLDGGSATGPLTPNLNNLPLESATKELEQTMEENAVETQTQPPPIVVNNTTQAAPPIMPAAPPQTAGVIVLRTQDPTIATYNSSIFDHPVTHPGIYGM